MAESIELCSNVNPHLFSLQATYLNFKVKEAKRAIGDEDPASANVHCVVADRLLCVVECEEERACAGCWSDFQTRSEASRVFAMMVAASQQTKILVKPS